MILGDGIRLRAPEREDIPLFTAWLNDPEVREGILMHLPISRAEEEGWFERMLARPADEHPFTIEILRPDGAWQAVGTCEIHNLEWRCSSGEIGIMVGDKTCWNQGIGTQVMRMLLRHGFYTLNLHRIYLFVFATNQRAVHVYEKIGFVQEGRLRDDMYRDGRYVDVLVMSVLRDEWKE
jgi:diamine N-acetyltransferase